MILAALLTSLISVGLHLYLTLQHYQLKLGLQAGPSACHINSTFNCDAVSVSSFSVLAGVPIAIWGAWTNLILALLIGLTMISLLSDKERVLRYAGQLAIFIALVSVAMGSISSLVLQTYCLYCMGAYILSFFTAIFLWKASHPFNPKTIASDIKDLGGGHRWILLTLLVVPVGSYLTQATIAQNYGLEKLQGLTAESLQSWTDAAPVDFNLEQGLVFQKSEKAPVMTIVEFADFLCPHCKMAYPTLHAFAEGRDDVKLIFKAFPLDGVCNKDIPQKHDGVRCELAAAVYCAEKLSKKGWALHHWIFDNQERFYQSGQLDKVLGEATAALGISLEEVKKCNQSDEIKDLVEHLAAEGFKAKIPGTPAVFVNGKTLDRGQFMPVLEALYQKLKASGN